MVMTDPIADMLTRIRNANQMRHDVVIMPSSNAKKSIAEILKAEGFIHNVEYAKGENNKEEMKISLKYDRSTNQRVITGLRRISKPGLRVYAKTEELPRVLSGLGIAIISTSQGVVTDKKARQLSVGGEVVAYVW
ncbi:30S ribosomal subunit protein S8 [Erysipelotrichaceae bacterium]|nr:30S ribosomal subunit protein S8 [Erysipelotrichaceae bacterium]